MTEKRCFDCAFCSVEYPSLRDICDRTEKYIEDVYSESCEMFERLNEEESK